MKIVELAFTGYPVTEMERARAFYEGILKLEPTRVIENPNGHWIEYDLDSSTFAISNMSKEEWKPSSDGPAVAFEVEDFDAAVGELRANNVKFVIEPFESPVCRTTIVADPDGNSVCIHKRHAR
jgi:predicted enzyme related to lactoylglutathione lyase